jgi:hypothetical protein
MCFARGDVRDHVVSHKNDHGPSYRPYRALQRQRRLKIHFREIFRVVRFSTFATVSPRKRTFRQRFNSKSGQSPCPSSRAIDSAVELSKSAIASKRRQLRSPIRWGRSSVLVGYWLGTGGVLVGYWFSTASELVAPPTTAIAAAQRTSGLEGWLFQCLTYCFDSVRVNEKARAELSLRRP